MKVTLLFSLLFFLPPKYKYVVTHYKLIERQLPQCDMGGGRTCAVYHAAFVRSEERDSVVFTRRDSALNYINKIGWIGILDSLLDVKLDSVKL
jgi:hypothetical protein